MTLTLHRRSLVMAAVTVLTLPAWPSQAASNVRHDAKPLLVSYRARDIKLPPPPSPFTPAEAAIVAQLLDALLPADQSPSATSLGTVDHVLQGLAQSGADSVAESKQGLAAIDGIAVQTYGVSMAQLAPAQRDAVVGTVTQLPALAPLWLGIRALAVLYYYAQTAAYKDLGLPGPNIDAGGFPQPNGVPCAA